jgi:hypothetical protein
MTNRDACLRDIERVKRLEIEFERFQYILKDFKEVLAKEVVEDFPSSKLHERARVRRAAFDLRIILKEITAK